MTKEINSNPSTVPEEKNETPKRKTKEKDVDSDGVAYGR